MSYARVRPGGRAAFAALSRFSRLTAPSCETKLVGLALCELHVMEAGDGPPLVIVPATVSELENWSSLVQFMSQWFHVYFFELPGHGKSSPLREGFSSDRVAVVVAQLVERIAAGRFSLMGFSFGGLLAMKTYLFLQDRIDRLILLSPCLTSRALRLSLMQRRVAATLNGLLKIAGVRTFLVASMQHQSARRAMAHLLHLAGKVENTRQLEHKLARMPPALVEIVACEVDEILSAEFPQPRNRYETPCYFAMSVRDPLLDYRTTLAEIGRHFANTRVVELAYPFHQPPRAFAFEELNEQFWSTVNEFLADFEPRATAPDGFHDRSSAPPGSLEPWMHGRPGL